MADEPQLDINLKAQSRREVVSLVASTLRNPPRTPAEVVQYAAKNFSASGSLGKLAGSLLPDIVGDALPIVGAVFDLFSGMSGPDVMDAIGQVTEAIAQVSEQISEEARLIKLEITRVSEEQATRTVSLIAQGATEIARSESAVRVMTTLDQLRQNEILSAIADEVWAEYGDEVTALQNEAQRIIADAAAAAQAEIDKYYAQLQELLGRDVYDWLKLIYEELSGEPAPQPEPQLTARAPGIVAAVEEPTTAESSGIPVPLILGAAALLLLMSQKRKKN